MNFKEDVHSGTVAVDVSSIPSFLPGIIPRQADVDFTNARLEPLEPDLARGWGAAFPEIYFTCRSD